MEIAVGFPGSNTIHRAFFGSVRIDAGLVVDPIFPSWIFLALLHCLAAILPHTQSCPRRYRVVDVSIDAPARAKNLLTGKSSWATGSLGGLPIIPRHPVARIGRHFRGVPLPVQ